MYLGTNEKMLQHAPAPKCRALKSNIFVDADHTWYQANRNSCIEIMIISTNAMAFEKDNHDWAANHWLRAYCTISGLGYDWGPSL